MKPALYLLASLCVALGPTVGLRSSWDEFTTPQGVAEIVTIAGGVVMAWLSESPKRKQS